MEEFLDISAEDAITYICCLMSPIRADILMQLFEREENKCCGTLSVMDDDGNWKYIGEIRGIHLGEVWFDEYNDTAKE